jgi:uncharacterized coiled-coil DUF342 family protein
MYRMRESWTDERMDDFRDEVNRRFEEVDRRFDAVDRRFDAVDRRLESLDNRLASLQRSLAIFHGTIIAALIGVIVTQL